MINQMLDALQSKSARVTKNHHHNLNLMKIDYISKNGNHVSAVVYLDKKRVTFSWVGNKNEQYIKEADLMAMLYYINEYGVAK